MSGCENYRCRTEYSSVGVFLAGLAGLVLFLGVVAGVVLVDSTGDGRGYLFAMFCLVALGVLMSLTSNNIALALVVFAALLLGVHYLTQPPSAVSGDFQVGAGKSEKVERGASSKWEAIQCHQGLSIELAKGVT